MSHRIETSHPRWYRVRLGDRGRLVLPAELRREAGLQAGDELVASRDGGGLRLVSDREMARVGRGAFAHLGQGRSVVDEFIADRRAEAATEIANASPKRSTLRK